MKSIQENKFLAYCEQEVTVQSDVEGIFLIFEEKGHSSNKLYLNEGDVEDLIASLQCAKEHQKKIK